MTQRDKRNRGSDHTLDDLRQSAKHVADNAQATEMTSSLEQFKRVMLRTMNKHGTTTQPNNA